MIVKIKQILSKLKNKIYAYKCCGILEVGDCKILSDYGLELAECSFLQKHFNGNIFDEHLICECLCENTSIESIPKQMREKILNFYYQHTYSKAELCVDWHYQVFDCNEEKEILEFINKSEDNVELVFYFLTNYV